ncbi:MAG: DUF3106 domain-containing protein [Betaproteobacteria bacterium]|nr:DUF3106 domain-containing protein [Betaproteobacteria bacterium]MSQ87724.1 DUF3106 domain-containing protein [Betaproteobacteria bacterium]
MAQENLRQLTRKVAAALLLCALAATSVFAAPKDRGPQWASLTADQQQVLAPLAGEWNKLSLRHKAKWLGIAKRYPAMKNEEQKRAQSRMQHWAKLTPEQRWQAREQYRSIGKLAPDRREELRRYWAEYQALPPHEKRMFDVPPSYLPPAERRQRATSAKKKPVPAYVLPASL